MFLFSISQFAYSQMDCAIDSLLKLYTNESEYYEQQSPGCPSINEDFSIEIPVIVHVLYNEGYENIDYTTVVDMISTANNQLVSGRLIKGHEENSSGYDVDIKLKLVDDGSCTPGYDRVYIDNPDMYANTNQEFNEEDERIKSESVWDEDKYLNVWIVRSIYWKGKHLGGYGTFPFMDDIIQGIVLDDNYLYAFIHEFGHYSSLYHVWQGGCVSDNGCTTGDYCDDIPAVIPLSAFLYIETDKCDKWIQGFYDESNNFNPLCNPPYIENLGYLHQYPANNFMTYQDVCWNYFSDDQYIRMVNCYEGPRNQIGVDIESFVDLSDDVDHTIDELLQKLGLTSLDELCNSTEQFNIKLGGRLILDSGPGNPICFSNKTNIQMLQNAEIRVIDNTTLDLNDIHIYGCDVFWNRIFIESGSSIDVSNNTLIEDGLNAITAEKGAFVNIDNTVFNNNNVGLLLTNTGYSSRNRTNVSISNTTFKSDDSFELNDEGVIKKRPFCGVNVIEQSRVILKSDLGNENYFNRLYNGIITYNSSIRVGYSNFEDIKNDLSYESDNLFAKYGYAVKLLRANSISSVNHVNISNSDYGIGAKGGGYTIAYDDDISVERIGYLVERVDKVKVKSSTINAGQKGIYIYNCPNMHVYFSQLLDNYITITSDDESAEAIDIQSTDNMDVYNNFIDINGNEAGIILNMADFTRLENNTIQVMGTNGGYPSNGIKISSSTDMEIKDNLLEDYTGYASDNNGILTESADGEYSCNYPFYFDRGMHFIGNCDNTRLLGNEFSYNQKDLLLGFEDIVGSTAGETWIGQQYEAGSGFGNKWLGDNSRVHNSATDNKISWSEFRVNATNDPDYIPDIIEAATQYWFNNKSGYENMHPCDDDPGSDLPPKYNCVEIINKILKIDTMSNVSECQKIVWMYSYYKKLLELKKKGLLTGDCLTFINTRRDSAIVHLGDISMTIDSIMLYGQNTSSLFTQLIELDSMLEVLYQQNQQGTEEWNHLMQDYDQKSNEYQAALQVEKTEDIFKLDSVKNVLNAVSVIDSCLKVIKRTNLIKINLLKSDSLSVSELSYLQEVSGYCPEEYGEGAYLARSMLGTYENIRYPGMEDCASGDLLPRNAKGRRYDEKMYLYPNPAFDKLDIKLNIKSGEQGTVEILDISGGLKYSKEVDENTNIIKLDVKDYITGVYLVKYTSSGGGSQVEKLIISK